METRGPASGGRFPWIAITVMLVLWASSFPVIKVALATFSPGQLALLRFVIASVVLGILLAFKGGRSPSARHVPGLVVCGVAGIAAYNLLVGYGQRSVGSGSAAMLVDTAPIYATLFAVVFLREKIGSGGWLGMLAAVVGIVFIGLGEGEGISIETGILYLIGAAISLSVFFALQKPYLPHYGAIGTTTFAVFAGTVALLPFSSGLVPTLLGASVSTVIAVAYLGIFPAAVAYVAWSYTLSKLPVAQAASFLYLIPPLTFLISWAVFGEELRIISVVGTAFSLLGVILVNRR